MTATATNWQTQPRDSQGRFGETDHAEPDVDLDTGNDEEPRIEAIYSDLDREDRLEAIKADLTTAISDIVNSGKLSQWLDLMSSNGMTRWSFQNRLLATLQGQERRQEADPEQLDGLPDGLMLMTAKQWKDKYERHPAKGAKAVWILAPSTRWITEEDPKTGEERKKKIVVGFRPQPVFEAVSTTGKDIPDPQVASFADGPGDERVEEHLKGKVAEFGYTYSERHLSHGPLTPYSMLGYTTADGSKHVVLDSRLSGPQKSATMAHELGHIACGHVEDPERYRQHRGEMETEAEMTGYLVARQTGGDPKDCESFSPGYIASWSKGDPETIEKSFTRATRAATKILEGFEEDPPK